MTIFIGVDPGLTGAWVCIDSQYLAPQPSYGRWDEIDILQDYIKAANRAERLISACIEKVHSMPRQGVVSSFTFGENYGFWQGFFQGLGVQYSFVTPEKWQKAVLDFIPSRVSAVSGEGFADPRKRLAENRKRLKNGITDFAQRKFPALRATLSVKKNQGIADALCIALYAKKVYI